MHALPAQTIPSSSSSPRDEQSLRGISAVLFVAVDSRRHRLRRNVRLVRHWRRTSRRLDRIWVVRVRFGISNRGALAWFLAHVMPPFKATFDVVFGSRSFTGIAK